MSLTRSELKERISTICLKFITSPFAEVSSVKPRFGKASKHSSDSL